MIEKNKFQFETLSIINFGSELKKKLFTALINRALSQTRWHYQSQVKVVVFINNKNFLQREEGTSFKLGKVLPSSALFMADSGERAI